MLLSVACEQSSSVGTGLRIDTIGTKLLIINPEVPAGWRWIYPQRTLSIGAALGDSTVTFGRIWDLDVGSNGDILVLDQQRKELIVFDSVGKHRITVGGEGDGPGEFRWPVRFVVKADSACVYDGLALRVTCFVSPSYALAKATRVPQSWLGTRELAAIGSARYWLQIGPSHRARPDEASDGIAQLLRFGEGVLDTVVVWSDSASTVAFSAVGFSSVAAVPYGHTGVWTAARDGRAFFSPGDEYRVVTFSPDGTKVRILKRQYHRFPLSRREEDWANRKVARMDDKLRSLVALPSLKPAVSQLEYDDARDVLWVRTSSSDDFEKQVWDAFACSSVFVASMQLPANLAVKRIQDGGIYGVQRDSLGVPYVRRFAAQAQAPLPEGCDVLQ